MDEYTKTRVKIYQIQEGKFTQIIKDIPYCAKIEQVEIGDSVVVDDVEYVHNGGGYGHDGEEKYCSFSLMPKEEWVRMQEENKRKRGWSEGMRAVRNVLEGKPLEEVIVQERVLHRVYNLEDLC